MLVVEVLDHTVEKYSIFKANDDINCSSVLPSKLFFTRLIWHSFAIQEDTTLEIWQSYVRWESRVTSKSFADATGSKDLSRKDTTGEEENLLSCLVAMSINLVLSGFILTADFHSTKLRRAVGLVLGLQSLCLRQVKKMTGRPWNRRHMIQDHTLEACKANRLDIMQNSNGERIAPWGTPWVIGRGSDKIELIRTDCDRPVR